MKFYHWSKSLKIGVGLVSFISVVALAKKEGPTEYQKLVQRLTQDSEAPFPGALSGMKLPVLRDLSTAKRLFVESKDVGVSELLAIYELVTKVPLPVLSATRIKQEKEALREWSQQKYENLHSQVARVELEKLSSDYLALKSGATASLAIFSMICRKKARVEGAPPIWKYLSALADMRRNEDKAYASQVLENFIEAHKGQEITDPTLKKDLDRAQEVLQLQ